MAIVVTSPNTVQNKNTEATTTLTAGDSFAVGDVAVLIGSYDYVAIDHPSVSDAQGNTWTVQTQANSAGVTSAIYYAAITTALSSSDVITITNNGANAGARAYRLLKVTGVDTSNLVMSYGGASATGVDGSVSTAINLDSTNCVMIYTGAWEGVVADFVTFGSVDGTPDTYAAFATSGGGAASNVGLAVASDISISTTGAKTWTNSSFLNTSRDLSAQLIVFRGAPPSPASATLTVTGQAPNVIVPRTIAVREYNASIGAQYTEWDETQKSTDIVVSADGLYISAGGLTTGGSIRAKTALTGKTYWEATITQYTVLSTLIGVTDVAGSSIPKWGYEAVNGNKYISGGSGTAYGASFTIGDVIGVAFDATTGSLEFFKNNVSQGVAYTGLTGTIYPAAYIYPASGNPEVVLKAAFSPQMIQYAPPSGYTEGVLVADTAPTAIVPDDARVTQVAVEVLTKTPATARVTQVAIEVLEQVGYFPRVGTLVITGNAPTLSITAPVAKTPANGTLTITGQAPTVGVSYKFTPAQDDLVATGQTPIASVKVVTTPANASLTITGQVPEALSARTLQPSNGTLTLTGAAPNVFIAHKAVPAQDDLIISGQAPVTSQNLKTLPAQDDLVVTGQAPSLQTDHRATPAQDDLVMSGQAPTTVVRMLVLPANATLTVTGQAPSTRATEAILEGYRWRNDDGTEVTATWRQVQDTNETAVVDEVVRLRVVIDGKDDLPSRDFELQYRKVGDTDWNKVK